jgi:hypothetical protein
VIRSGTTTRSHGGRKTLPGTALGALLQGAEARKEGNLEAGYPRLGRSEVVLTDARLVAVVGERSPTIGILGRRRPLSFDEAAVESGPGDRWKRDSRPVEEGRDRGCQRLVRGPAARSKTPPEKWGSVVSEDP